jgi:hypothetical protein
MASQPSVPQAAPIASSSLQAPREPPKSDQEKLEEILGLIQRRGFMFPRFLETLLSIHAQGTGNVVSNTLVPFLGSTRTQPSITQLLELIYNHRFSAPKKSRGGRASTHTSDDADIRNEWARHRMRQWALEVVSSMISEEVGLLMTTESNPLCMNKQALSWAVIYGWNITALMDHVKKRAPTLWRLVTTIACRDSRPSTNSKESTHPRNPQLVSCCSRYMSHSL